MARDWSKQIREGMDVLDSRGDKIGTAGEVMPDGQSFNVDAGVLGRGGEYSIPFSAVREVRAKSIYVNAAKDELHRQGWSAPSSERAATTETTARATTGQRQTVPLREEELQAHKQPVEKGRVEIGKEVVEEQKTLEVPVTREEVTVERHSVPRRASDTPIGEGDETIRVPVHEEQVEVTKRPVVTEEISVGKQQVQEKRQVSGTVRREEARIEGEGDVKSDLDVERKR